MSENIDFLKPEMTMPLNYLFYPNNTFKLRDTQWTMAWDKQKQQLLKSWNFGIFGKKNNSKHILITIINWLSKQLQIFFLNSMNLRNGSVLKCSCVVVIISGHLYLFDSLFAFILFIWSGIFEAYDYIILFIVFCCYWFGCVVLGLAALFNLFFFLLLDLAFTIVFMFYLDVF